MLYLALTIDAGSHRVRPADGIDFRILGSFEVFEFGSTVEIGSPKQRVLLATLVLNAGRTVLVKELADAIWGCDQPTKSRRAVQLYVTRLRAVLARGGGRHLITTATNGYRLNIRADQCDIGRFRQGLDQADTALRRGDLDGEAVALAAALSEWRGEPLAGLPSELLQRESAPKLHEQWLHALERRFDVELRRGRHAELVSELVGLTAENPLREPLWVYRIKALAAAGRRADALDSYHAARQQLAEELGVDPGEELQRVHHAVLTGGPLQPDSQAGRVVAGLVPRQLPADVPAFAGRAEALASLDALLTAHDQRPAAAVVSVIAGTAGIGKTALAIHWARRVADRFPDGQLWLNLDGLARGRAVSPAQALTHLLRALGVADADVPLDPDGKSNLYRSLMDGRRMLVVLDNARSPEQVRPLLPGAPGCVVLVTSRGQLSGLIATENAHPFGLDLLSSADADKMLAGRLGRERVQADPAAAEEIVDLCARLPLALAIIAARAAAHPEFGLGTFAAELRRAQGSLDAFAGPDPVTGLRTSLSWSYEALSTPAATLFRLLGAHPGSDIDVPATASLTGLTTRQTRLLLTELRDAHLITEPAPGRYTFHDLLRAYAIELGQHTDAPFCQQLANRSKILGRRVS